MKRKLIAIHSGGDWADASVDYLVMITDINPDELKERYPSYSQCRMSLANWLIKEGYATEAGDNDITVIDED